MKSRASERPPFGALLRRLRLEANLSQEELAERARISKQAISSLERGARRAPQLQTFNLLTQALELGAAERAELEAAAAESIKARVRRPVLPATFCATSAGALPVNVSTFVGRDADCERLIHAVRPGTCVTIWGSGGIGKTRLALEAARTASDRFPDGVRFVELANVLEDDSVVHSVAAGLGICDRSAVATLDTIVESLDGAQTLIVLDNCEHVVAGCAVVVDRLLRGARSVAVVCTSREPLRTAGEHIFALGPLADADASHLFENRALSLGVAIDESREAAAVATICARLDAIPLAIELAAARTPTMTTSEIARGLDDRFRLLTLGSRSTSQRHRTLESVIAWSFDMLSATERTVLERVSIWPNLWSLEDAIAIAADASIDRWATIDAIGKLVHCSLAIVTPSDRDERTFRLLQSTREFASLRANESADSRERRLAMRVRAIVEAANDASMRGVEPPARIDVDALRSVLHWAVVLRNDVALGTAVAGYATAIRAFRNDTVIVC